MRIRLRSRLVRGTTASILAAAMVLPGAAQPAQAVVDPATIMAVIQFAQAAFSQFTSSQHGGLTLEDATARIINEVRNSEAIILAHTDALAVAEASACARHHVLEFQDIEDFSTSLKQRWAQDVTGCVTLIDALWNSVGAGNFAAKNELAISLGAVGPIALIARAQAHFSTADLTALLINAFTNARNTFTPFGWATPIVVSEEWWMYHPEPVWLDGYYWCTGPWDFAAQTFIGEGGRFDSGWWQGGTVLQYDHWNEICTAASQNSAHGVAVAALAALQP